MEGLLALAAVVVFIAGLGIVTNCLDALLERWER
jgi:hypothetical protein